MKRRIRDVLAVLAFAAVIVGTIASVWAFAAMFACMITAAFIDPDTTRARAREYRRQQRGQYNRALIQRAREARQRPGPWQLHVPVQGRMLDCGCVQIPGQVVHCSAHTALSEIEQLAQGEMS